MLRLEYFLAVAKYLNFTEAAESHYISQPSLSKQISLLEKELGFSLFYRNNRSVRLTAEGAMLYKDLSEIFKRIDEAIENAKRYRVGVNDVLRIGCLEALNTSSYLPQAITFLKEKYPELNLIFERNSFKDLREKLINGNLDLIFTYEFEVKDLPGVIYDIVHESNINIVMSKTYGISDEEVKALKDIKARDFVCITQKESPMGFTSILEFCKKNNFGPSVIHELPNIESMLLSIDAGVGVSLIDAETIIYNKERFRMIKVQDEKIKTAMVWKKNNLNVTLTIFINTVLDNILPSDDNDF